MHLSVNQGIVLLLMILWTIPLVFILTDPIVTRRERIAWVFATLCVSWFAWLLFLWLAPVLPRKKHFQ